MSDKVLVVDDDPEICELVSLALSSKGLDVKTAMTGDEGLRDISEFKPGVILLDHRLKGADGIEVAKKMKETDAGKSASIIMMSGSDKAVSELDPGLFVDSLKKPFRLSDMIKCVEKHFNK